MLKIEENERERDYHADHYVDKIIVVFGFRRGVNEIFTLLQQVVPKLGN
jgi:hypothetical protein